MSNLPQNTQAAQNPRSVLLAGEDTANEVFRHVAVNPDGSLVTSAAIALPPVLDVDIVSQSIGDITAQITNTPDVAVPGGVNVNNFPTSFDVNVTNPILGVDILNAPNVNVQNFPATQVISGSVGITNFPAVQDINILSQADPVEVDVITPVLDVDIQNFPPGFDANITNASLDVEVPNGVDINSLPPVDVIGEKNATPNTDATVAVTNTSSVLLLSANPSRIGFRITNNSGGILYVTPGPTAVPGTGVQGVASHRINNNGGQLSSLDMPGYTGPISAIAGTGGNNFVAVTEW